MTDTIRPHTTKGPTVTLRVQLHRRRNDIGTMTLFNPTKVTPTVKVRRFRYTKMYKTGMSVVTITDTRHIKQEVQTLLDTGEEIPATSTTVTEDGVRPSTPMFTPYNSPEVTTPLRLREHGFLSHVTPSSRVLSQHDIDEFRTPKHI